MIFCSFCGRSQNESATTIVGETGVAICDRCVDICVPIVEKDRRKSDAGAEDAAGALGEMNKIESDGVDIDAVHRR